MDVDKELEELFNDPLFDLTDKEQSLFDMPADMQKVIKQQSKNRPDYVAQRTPCKDFGNYKFLFEQVQNDLKTGKRSLLKIHKTDILKKDRFFVVGGQLVLLAEIGELSKASKGSLDGRTRCIYEDGMESDIMLQTLRKNVVTDGYGVTELQQETERVFFNNDDIESGDKVTGYIYVLKSLSCIDEIKNQKDLYKIGFTTQTVEKRIANAQHEPTYLMAPVQIVETYKVVNMNSHILETLIHNVLAHVKFRVIVNDDEGKTSEPSEWYVVPLGIIKKIIEKIVDGTIVDYTYNAAAQCLEKHVKSHASHFNLKGLKVLTLNIKKIFFDDIISGFKTTEYRVLKQTTLNKYTYVDEADGKRYLRPYDVIRFFVGYNKERESAIVEVKGIKYNEQTGNVEYDLGRILEHIPL